MLPSGRDEQREVLRAPREAPALSHVVTRSCSQGPAHALPMGQQLDSGQHRPSALAPHILQTSRGKTWLHNPTPARAMASGRGRCRLVRSEDPGHTPWVHPRPAPADCADLGKSLNLSVPLFRLGELRNNIKTTHFTGCENYESKQCWHKVSAEQRFWLLS